ncbi:DUF72 domain-containing protein, partial [Vibrio genomosp. F10 str. 9ZC157]|uniref:DUF72 domain-containing protein n=1 Tax=Vibrio genomosp. F10 TaxID=723171 RepID=UPI00037C94CE
TALPISTTEAVIDAHQKKPRVPVHAIATAENPVIRFIGHPEQDANVAFFEPWLKKLPIWIAEGKQPYVMIHTPDNVEAPQLATRLYDKLAEEVSLPPLADFPAMKGDHQMSMF